ALQLRKNNSVPGMNARTALRRRKPSSRFSGNSGTRPSMRPVKLTLEGFTSFIDRTELDFSNLDLFAIVGPTGSGKRSLLDAMTCALHGSTPSPSHTTVFTIRHDAAPSARHFWFHAAGAPVSAARTARRARTPNTQQARYYGDRIPADTNGAAKSNDAVC